MVLFSAAICLYISWLSGPCSSWVDSPKPFLLFALLLLTTLEGLATQHSFTWNYRSMERLGLGSFQSLIVASVKDSRFRVHENFGSKASTALGKSPYARSCVLFPSSLCLRYLTISLACSFLLQSLSLHCLVAPSASRKPAAPPFAN